MLALGSTAGVDAGTVDAEVENVKIPVVDTLYVVAEAPLNVKGNGTVWFADQVGVPLGP